MRDIVGRGRPGRRDDVDHRGGFAVEFDLGFSDDDHHLDHHDVEYHDHS